MRATTVFLIIIILALLILPVFKSDAKDPHWYYRRSTATGRHAWYVPNWGGSCPTYGLVPTKAKYYNRLRRWKPGKNNRFN